MLTIDLKDALLCLLIVGALVLVIYLIIATYNLIKTLKQSQKVLTDFEVVAKITSERTQQLDKFIAQTQEKLKSGKNILNSLPVIFSAIANIAKTVGSKRSEKTKDAKNK